MLAYIRVWLARRFAELAKTCKSLCRAALDAWIVTTPRVYSRRPGTFAFLVHPRTADFCGSDTYGKNDIFRPFPLLDWLNYFCGSERAGKLILRFARWIKPITLSRITVRLPDGTKKRGYLMSTVRTPVQLFDTNAGETRDHLRQLFALAAGRNVERVGLGALLPAMTKYGKIFTETELSARPAVSTGHAYTGYVIVDYLRYLSHHRNRGQRIIRVGIIGANGSTGRAVVRAIGATWDEPCRIDLVLVDLPKSKLQLMKLAAEAREYGGVANVYTAEAEALRTCEYVVVVTNATGLTVTSDLLEPGTVVLDDSQPRNTSRELTASGVHVLDVLARVPGLNVGFDFGFRTKDRTITFTCLAETVIAAAVGRKTDLAVGEVTPEVMQEVVDMVREAELLGLIGTPPLVSFGRELTRTEINQILEPPTPRGGRVIPLHAAE